MRQSLDIALRLFNGVFLLFDDIINSIPRLVTHTMINLDQIDSRKILVNGVLFSDEAVSREECASVCTAVDQRMDRITVGPDRRNDNLAMRRFITTEDSWWTD